MQMKRASRAGHAAIRPIAVRVTPLAAGVAVAMGSFAGTALATDELVVTATRRDTTVQEVPYSIGVVTDETLRELNITDLSGIARWSSGLYQVDQGARDANVLVIRGLNANSVNAPELLNNDNDRVATYFGETPVYINLLPLDIQRVEVLRGPQGTIFGARSLSGAVRYIPNKPDTQDFTLDAHVRAYSTEESNDRSQEADVVVNVPLVQDTLALRGLLGYAYEGGFIDYNYVVPEPGVSCPEPGFTTGCSDDGFISEADADHVRTRSYGLSLLWTPFDDLEATLSWRQQDREIGGRSATTRVADSAIEAFRGIDMVAGDYVSSYRFTEPQERTNDIYNLTVVWNNELGELTSSTSYTEYESHGRRDQTDFLLDAEYGYEQFPAFAAFTNDVLDDEVFTQEVRLVSNDNDSRFNWLAGAFYQESDFFSRSQEFTPGISDFFLLGPLPTGDLEYDNKTFEERTELALFGEVGYAVTDELSILVGARWFDFESQLRSCTAFPFFGPPFDDVDNPVNCTPETGFDKADDDDVLGKFSVNYLLSDAMNAYFTYSEGYSTSTVNAGNIGPNEDRFVGPERSDNYEVGVKGAWLDNQVTMSAALFLVQLDDVQVAGFADTGSAVLRNLGEAESKGLELEGAAQITERWQLAAGYAFTDAHLTEGCADLPNPDGLALADLCGADFIDAADGDRLPGSPVHQLYFRATFLTPVSGDMDFRATYGLNTQSDVLTKLGNGSDGCCRDDGERLGGFTLHNLAASLITETWEATVFVENLTNKYAITGVRNDRANIRQVDAGFNDFTVRRYYEDVVRPRNVGIDFRYRFR